MVNYTVHTKAHTTVYSRRSLRGEIIMFPPLHSSFLIFPFVCFLIFDEISKVSDNNTLRVLSRPVQFSISAIFANSCANFVFDISLKQPVIRECGNTSECSLDLNRGGSNSVVVQRNTWYFSMW